MGRGARRSAPEAGVGVLARPLWHLWHLTQPLPRGALVECVLISAGLGCGHSSQRQWPLSYTALRK